MKKKITKKELAKISKLTILYSHTLADATDLLRSIMNKLGNVEFDIINVDDATMLRYFDKHNYVITCYLIRVEMVDDKLFYYVVDSDNVETDDEGCIIGGKYDKIDACWFEFDSVFDVLSIISETAK